MEITALAPAPEGWYIEFTTEQFPVNYLHLTLEKIEELREGMVYPNIVPGPDESLKQARAKHPVNQALNLLRYWINDEDKVRELFPLAYGQIVGNRVARLRLGLKAVTLDGDEDLKAVQEGAPVRPWNAAKGESSISGFVKERKNARLRDRN